MDQRRITLFFAIPMLFLLTAVAAPILGKIGDNTDDGTEVNGRQWFKNGYHATWNYLGSMMGKRFDGGFRFKANDLVAGEEVAYARLRFASFGSEISTSAVLRIEGVLQPSPSTFSEVERPSQKNPKTRNRVLFEISENWDSGSEDLPLYYASPDISPIINEVLSMPGWGDGVNGKALMITLTGQSDRLASQTKRPPNNYVMFDDYKSVSIMPLRSPVKLEVYKTLYDTFLGKEMLGRPTDTSITANLFCLLKTDLYLEYGTAPGIYTFRTPAALDNAAEQPVEFTLKHLNPDSRYYYRLVYRRAGTGAFEKGPERSFHTCRARKSPFTFAIQADEHLIPMYKIPQDPTRKKLYRNTLQNIADAHPDFLLSLGDFAHTEFKKSRNAANPMEAEYRYLLQREYLGSVTHSIPFFLVLGNHEGEQGWYYPNLSNTNNHKTLLPVISATARKALISNPRPDRFYSGNEQPAMSQGLLEDYYSWEWGDALFVVLSPYWHTKHSPQGNHDGWCWTLGREQYDWLYATLHGSDSQWKFVFIHHLTSTIAEGFYAYYGRGGAEVAKYKVAGRPSFEWGGEDETGAYVFAAQRPGWSHGAVHDLLVAEGVDIVFHGHDHLFAKQDLDGIVYQECPQPGDDKYSMGYMKESKYEEGVLLPNSGHLLGTVSPDSVRIDYIRSYLPGEGDNGEISFSYTLTQ